MNQYYFNYFTTGTINQRWSYINNTRDILTKDPIWISMDKIRSQMADNHQWHILHSILDCRYHRLDNGGFVLL